MLSSKLAFCILLVKRPNVKGIGGVDLAAWRDEGRRIFLLVHNVPVDAREERMLLKFVCTIASTPESLVYISLEFELTLEIPSD